MPNRFPYKKWRFVFIQHSIILFIYYNVLHTYPYVPNLNLLFQYTQYYLLIVEQIFFKAFIQLFHFKFNCNGHCNCWKMKQKKYIYMYRYVYMYIFHY